MATVPYKLYIERDYQTVVCEIGPRFTVEGILSCTESISSAASFFEYDKVLVDVSHIEDVILTLLLRNDAIIKALFVCGRPWKRALVVESFTPEIISNEKLAISLGQHFKIFVNKESALNWLSYQ
jgi:uncharacterized protein (DUF2384 family)